jgi:hypothetical protein
MDGTRKDRQMLVSAKLKDCFTPVEYESKRPLLKEWQKGEILEEDFKQLFSSGPINIGIELHPQVRNGEGDLDYCGRRENLASEICD